jgi:aminopeptidase YwaD
MTLERGRVNGSPGVTSAPERHPILRHLVSLGPRVAGEDSERGAAVYVASVLRDLGLETQLEPFTFVGWRQTTPACVTVHVPLLLELQTAAMAYTDSTPPEGVTGNLQRIGTSYILPGVVEWPVYAVVDERGQEVAYVLRRAGGRAYPVPNTYPHPSLMTVAVNIGDADADQIDEWLADDEVVRVTVVTAGERVPGLVSNNVIARLPGRTDDEIIVSSHLDTAPGSPGADDNASGTQGLYDLAARLVAEGPLERTVMFVAFGAEEYGMLGSFRYVANRKTRGSLSTVRATINLDAIGAGEALWCYVAPNSLRTLVENELVRSRASDRFSSITFAETKRSVDAYPFHAEGIPNVSFIGWPYDDYHQPTDDLALIDHDLVDYLTTISHALTRSLVETDPAWLTM